MSQLFLNGGIDIGYRPVCWSCGFVGWLGVGFAPLILAAGIWCLSVSGFPVIGIVFSLFWFWLVCGVWVFSAFGVSCWHFWVTLFWCCGGVWHYLFHSFGLIGCSGLPVLPYRFPAAAISGVSISSYVSAVDSSSSGSGPFTCAIVFTLYHTF